MNTTLITLCFSAWLASTSPARLPEPAAPLILASVPLSALPANHANGIGGPINRFAIDLEGFTPASADPWIECVYARNLRYRCRYEPQTAPAARQRIHVQVPDLDRGERVVLRVGNAHGTSEIAVELTNPPHAVHEIEGLALPGGGQSALGPDGVRAPVRKLLSHQGSTAPDLAALAAPDQPVCDRIVPQWSRASATEALFTGPFGAVTGSVLLVKPLPHASPVGPDNLPLWHITYEASATRAQFIAHYEFIYRVGTCENRIIGP